MQALKLEMQAFGPFVELQVIDFTVFKESKLFMISGKTGSGKSTIFDAICYSLYGATSIDGRNLTQLYSDFAPVGSKSYVKFTWKTLSDIYTVKRFPVQFREKKRGSGLVEETAKVELYKGDELIETKINLANKKIIEIIGLDLNQFRQIALLAQGEFKRLLLADSKAREEIFRKIFNTNDYLKIQEQYKQKTIELRKQIQETETKINTLMEQVSSEEFTNIERLEKIIDQELETYGKKKMELQVQLEQEQDALEQLGQQNSIAKEYKQRKEELEKITKFLSDLNQKAPKIQEDEKILSKYQKLKPYQENYRLYTQANSKLTELATEQENTLQKKQKLEILKKEQKENVIETLKQRKEELIIEKSQLTLQLEQLNESQKKYAEYIKLNSECQNQEQLQAKLAKEIEAKKQTQQNYQKSQALLLKLEQDLFTSNSVLVEIKQKQEAKEQWTAIDNARNKQRTVIETLKSEIICQQDRLRDLEQKYYKYTSGILAENLKSNEACPVCGSIEHPNLANQTTEIVKLDQLLKEREILDNSQIKLQAEKTKFQNQSNELEKLAKLFNSDHDYDEELEVINLKIKSLESDKKQINLNLAKLSGLEQEIGELEKQVSIKQEQIKKSQVELNSLNLSGHDPEKMKVQKQDYETRMIKLDQELQAKNAQLVKAENRKSEIQKLNIEIKSIEQRVQQQFEQETKIKLANKKIIEQVMSKEALSVSDFDLSMEVDITEIARKIENYYSQVREFKKNKLILQEKIERLHPKLDGELKNKIAQTTTNIEQLNQEIGKIKNETGQLKSLFASILQLYNDNKEILSEYQKLNNINSMLNGRYKPYVSFERYILASYFQKIIEFGNIRLTKLTNGRYQFNVNSAFKKGQSQQGLDLTITDFYTGKERDISSLSGGESFKAAISLALGLSDVVRFENGGIELNSLFIDEGFGTLDEESLDQAITVIMDLEADGRMVGIISHVDELKNQIKQQIQVSRSSKGSTVKIQS